MQGSTVSILWLITLATENDNPAHMEQRDAILRYLESHPHAADTVDGIVNWWLPLQRYQDTFEMVEKILEELVMDGQVVKTSLPDNKVIYICASAKSTGGEQG